MVREASKATASPFLFSTAAPPILWRFNAEALQIGLKMKHERETILRLGQEFRTLAGQRGLLVEGELHISSVHIDPDWDAKAFENTLANSGFF